MLEPHDDLTYSSMVCLVAYLSSSNTEQACLIWSQAPSQDVPCYSIDSRNNISQRHFTRPLERE